MNGNGNGMSTGGIRVEVEVEAPTNDNGNGNGNGNNGGKTIVGILVMLFNAFIVFFIVLPLVAFAYVGSCVGDVLEETEKQDVEYTYPVRD
jgi:hypothetical protein